MDQEQELIFTALGSRSGIITGSRQGKTASLDQVNFVYSFAAIDRLKYLLPELSNKKGLEAEKKKRPKTQPRGDAEKEKKAYSEKEKGHTDNAVNSPSSSTTSV